jgi:hypothetical protein
MSEQSLVETSGARGWWSRLGRARPRALPSERAAADTRANVRRVAHAMLIAFALMALFNSSGLRSYVRDLPPGWIADQAVAGADGWHELMVALGPAELRPAVRELFESVRELQW